MTSLKSSTWQKSFADWAPWLLVLAGLVVVVGLGAFMSRVRTQPTIQGEFSEQEFAAIVSLLRQSRGAHIRCDELQRHGDDEAWALIATAVGPEARYERIKLARRDGRWLAIEVKSLQ